MTINLGGLYPSRHERGYAGRHAVVAELWSRLGEDLEVSDMTSSQAEAPPSVQKRPVRRAGLQQANLAGDRSRIKGLSQVIDKRQKDLLKLAPIVVQWRNLDQAINAAQTEYNHAVIDLNLVNAQIASDHDPRTITVFVDSENGSRLSLPSMVRAPFTVMGTSSATGWGFAVESPGGPADPERAFS